jgi:hypothetical protein
VVVHHDDGGAVEADGLLEYLADAHERAVETADVDGVDLLDPVLVG